MLGHTPTHAMLHVHAQQRVCLVRPQLRESSETIALTEPSVERKFLDTTTEVPEPMSAEEVNEIKNVQKKSGTRIDVVWDGRRNKVRPATERGTATRPDWTSTGAEMMLTLLAVTKGGRVTIHILMTRA